MPESHRIHIVALSSAERAEQARACYDAGYHAEIYGNYEELVAAAPDRGMVVAEDIAERGGVEALMAMAEAAGLWLPVLATAPNPRPQRVVEAVRAGAFDYLSLPLERHELLAALQRASVEASRLGQAHRQAIAARSALSLLTQREREVLDLLVSGHSNKMIARDLQISPRTVEIHRAHMMTKLGASHVADAIRLRLEANLGGAQVASIGRQLTA